MLRMQAIRSALLVTVAFGAVASAPYFAFRTVASAPYFPFRDDSLAHLIDRQIKTQDQISREDQIADLRALIDRMSQLDQERVEEIKSLAQRQATLEQVILGIAKDRLIQAQNGLPASGTIDSRAVPSPIETTSRHPIPHVRSARPEATTNDKKVRLPPRKRAPVVRRQIQEAPTVAANPNASRPEMQNY